MPIKVIRSAETMETLKTFIRWFLKFLHYVVVSIMIGNLADHVVFILLENEIFRMLDYGEEVGDQVGEDVVGGPDGGGEGRVGAEISGGGQV